MFIRFVTDRSVPAVSWKLSGPEDGVEAIDLGIKEVIRQIKRPYSLVYAGEIKGLLLDGACALVILAPFFLVFYWLLDRWRSTSESRPQHFRLPSGEIVHLTPLVPIEESSGPTFWTYVLPYAYVLAITFLVLRLLRPFYPIGMFEIGFEAGRIRRRSALQTNIFWGGIACFLIGIAAPALWEYRGYLFPSH